MEREGWTESEGGGEGGGIWKRIRGGEGSLLVKIFHLRFLNVLNSL